MRGRTLAGTIGLAVVTALVLTITLTPNTVDAGYQDEIAQLLTWLHRHGVPAWFGYRHLEFGANIAMFIPLGFCFGLLPARRSWIALILLSIAIEGAQLLFLPGRVASLPDVVANSVGALAGYWAARWVPPRRKPAAARAPKPHKSETRYSVSIHI